MKILNFKFQTVAKCMFVLCVAVLFQSCEVDPVQGCTDPESTSYDILAVEDDGSCTYEADKFVGSFAGPFECASASIVDNLTVTIAEDDLTSKDTVSMLLSTSIFTDIPATGVVSGDVIVMTVSQTNQMVESNGVMVEADITMDGTMTLSSDETTLEGSTTLDAKSSATGSTILTSDNCSFTGTRQ